MKHFLLISFALASNLHFATANANTLNASSQGSEKIYALALEVSIQGATPIFANILAKDGSKTLIEQTTNDRTIFLEVTAKSETNREGGPALLTTYAIGTIDKKGNRTIYETPKIISEENGKAEVTVKNMDNSKRLSVAVTWSTPTTQK